jgi:sugar phosphate isomerase/epimerase
MKLSCIPVSFFPQILRGKMSVEEWARIGASVGLDAIDLSILFIKDRDSISLGRLRKDIEGAGVRVAMVTTYPDFTHPDRAQREREVVQSREDIAVAARLGAELVRVTAGQAHPETGREEGISWAVAGLTAVLDAGRDNGVTLVFENHAKPGAWQYSDFCHPTDIFLAIVEATAGTSLGVNWDTANTLAYGDDPLPVLEKVLDRVVSVHAADTAVRGELRHVALGTGIVPFRDMFSMLKGAGFDGWVCLEEASFQGKAGLEAAVGFVWRTWEEA